MRLEQCEICGATINLKTPSYTPDGKKWYHQGCLFDRIVKDFEDEKERKYLSG